MQNKEQNIKNISSVMLAFKHMVVSMCMNIIVCLSVCSIVCVFLPPSSVQSSDPGHIFIKGLRFTLFFLLRMLKKNIVVELLHYLYQSDTTAN